jgi:transglutaminase-like putative cysteine protease
MLITTLHETAFEYERAVHASFTEVRLCPLSDEHQRCLSFSLSVDPGAPISTGSDYFGNVSHTFNILSPHRCLVVTGYSVVETNREPFKAREPLPQWEVQRAQADFLGFDGPVEDIQPVRELARRAGLLARAMSQEQVLGTMRQSQTIFTDLFASAQELNGLIYESFSYAPATTGADTRISHVFESGGGVCQDFAHVFIAACRAANLPARYVSGYLVTRRSRSGEGTTASHAWAEVMLPGGNWVGFDPTNKLLANNFYIKVAVGRDYRDVAPTRGLFRGQAGHTNLRVRVHTTVDGEDSSAPQPELVG